MHPRFVLRLVLGLLTSFAMIGVLLFLSAPIKNAFAQAYTATPPRSVATNTSVPAATSTTAAVTATSSATTQAATATVPRLPTSAPPGVPGLPTNIAPPVGQPPVGQPTAPSIATGIATILAPTPTIGLPKTGDGTRIPRQGPGIEWGLAALPIALFGGAVAYRFRSSRKRG